MRLGENRAGSPSDVSSQEVNRSGRGKPEGGFVDFMDDRCYAIWNVDSMPPFLMSIVSSSDHWLFCASNGGLTAGRRSPESALFPYQSVDKIYDSAEHTGSTTTIRVSEPDAVRLWRPFKGDGLESPGIRRNLFKSITGNRVWFEELNDTLQLGLRYSWTFSEEFGLVRYCELVNLGNDRSEVQILDGLQNLLPADTPRRLQADSSNLVDAYKWCEVDPPSGLAIYRLYSGISDKPAPLESLRASSVFSVGLESRRILLANDQLREFCLDGSVAPDRVKTGVRGAYLVESRIELAPGESRGWWIVADVNQTHSKIVALRKRLAEPAALLADLESSIARGTRQLNEIVAGCDGLQATAEPNVSVHHYANVLFNLLRGGAFREQYDVDTDDLRDTIELFNRAVFERHSEFLKGLPDRLRYDEMLTTISAQGDPWLERLCREYLPFSFGRRHGDPSRPWNEFDIRLRDDAGRTVYYYQGNWRDIFQNWEAAALSFPLFSISMIARFVNGSTVDGYNPYRITKDGIDWEVEDPEDPWSFIGYWGDHQVIYLLKLLELARDFEPDELANCLYENRFAYANVPYRIKPFADLLTDPKHTIDYDAALADVVEERVREIGADGQLVMDGETRVYLVSLAEKLLVVLLAKLANLIPGGGIWMNTQRPEWNDANNALVGYGVSVVTLCYLRRFICFLKDLLHQDDRSLEVSIEVSDWLRATLECFETDALAIEQTTADDAARSRMLTRLGTAASEYRARVYAQNGFTGKTQVGTDEIRRLLESALAVTEQSIRCNRREDGLYHAYRILDIHDGGIALDELQPMLEGQVAALSSGALGSTESTRMLDALFDGELYRSDQHSFMLYPDDRQASYYDFNRVPRHLVAADPARYQPLIRSEDGVLVEDADGNLRFDADLVNERAVRERCDRLAPVVGIPVADLKRTALDLYEQVFQHKAYTGRSGGMFGFEGLGCIYWHMVAKLLLAAQESFFRALELERDPASASRLGAAYYRIREGIGFNKSPAEYGAFPYDPYSHTPRHAGAQQPGMTGQVKEEILTRFGELGLRVRDGQLRFLPGLLRRREFVDADSSFSYMDVGGRWHQLDLPADSLAFTYCQVPMLYVLDGGGAEYIEVTDGQGATTRIDSLALPKSICKEIFHRTGAVTGLTLHLSNDGLFDG